MSGNADSGAQAPGFNFNTPIPAVDVMDVDFVHNDVSEQTNNPQEPDGEPLPASCPPSQLPRPPKGGTPLLPTTRFLQQRYPWLMDKDSNSDEPLDAEIPAPGRRKINYPCLASDCDETFPSSKARITHARAHEFDADQRHLAAYFFCHVGQCTETKNVDIGDGRYYRKKQLTTHLRRKHSALTHGQQVRERALIVERTYLARKYVGLGLINRDSAHYAREASRATELLPPLPPAQDE